ncbi:hypothetical protein NAPIS_ORF02408 [Vairimorpha apis BRL 01]|uniref:Uncharacterized protein n=1 Tax=Vairimorpha apis BRL 01 TaxID=1037528 RepID=T0KXC7_9MICR|nr:hypothetical protein NAPIS_ORF02408 [Vairimorpha apis BRL 01]
METRIESRRYFTRDSLSPLLNEKDPKMVVHCDALAIKKLASNDDCCADTGVLLEGLQVYKYMKSFIKMRDEMLARMERLCNSLDYLIIKILVKHKAHLLPDYHGIHNIEIRVEKAAVLKVEHDNKSYISLIKTYLEKVSKTLRSDIRKETSGLETRHLSVTSKTEMSSEENYNLPSATRCGKMLGHDYTRRHNEVENDLTEIKVNTRLKTDIKVVKNRPDIYILNKIKCENGLIELNRKGEEVRIIKKRKYLQQLETIEIGVTSIDNLQRIETEKLRKYDLLANELGLIHECKTRIIPYVLTWNGLITKYHAKYRKARNSDRIEAYIQSVNLKKTLESVSMEYRREDDLILSENDRNENLHTNTNSEINEKYIKQINTNKKTLYDSKLHDNNDKQSNKNIPFKKLIIGKNILENKQLYFKNDLKINMNSTFNINNEINLCRDYLKKNYVNDNNIVLTNIEFNFKSDLNNYKNILEVIFKNLEYCSKEIKGLEYLMNSKAFFHLFEILQKDFLNTLKGHNYLNIKSKYIINLICYIENNKANFQKIPFFIEILKEIMSFEINSDLSLNFVQNQFINTTLLTNYKTTSSFDNIYFKLQSKLKKINSNLNINIKLYEIFRYTIKLFLNTTDQNLQIFFLYGMQNLFICDSYKTMPRFLNVLIFLYTYNNEKKFYDFDWHKKLFSILSISPNSIEKKCNFAQKLNIERKNFMLYISYLIDVLRYRLWLMKNSCKRQKPFPPIIVSFKNNDLLRRAGYEKREAKKIMREIPLKANGSESTKNLNMRIKFLIIKSQFIEKKTLEEESKTIKNYFYDNISDIGKQISSHTLKEFVRITKFLQKIKNDFKTIICMSNIYNLKIRFITKVLQLMNKIKCFIRELTDKTDDNAIFMKSGTLCKAKIRNGLNLEYRERNLTIKLYTKGSKVEIQAKNKLFVESDIVKCVPPYEFFERYRYLEITKDVFNNRYFGTIEKFNNKNSISFINYQIIFDFDICQVHLQQACKKVFYNYMKNIIDVFYMHEFLYRSSSKSFISTYRIGIYYAIRRTLNSLCITQEEYTIKSKIEVITFKKSCINVMAKAFHSSECKIKEVQPSCK